MNLTYEQLLALDLDQIAEAFPLGAMEFKGRWQPATPNEEADRPLRRLLKDKKATLPQDRFLRASYSVPKKYVSDPNAEDDERNENYVDGPFRAMRGEPAAVDEATQKRFDRERREAHEARKEARPLWMLLKDVEENGLNERQKASIRRRIEAARRAKAA